MLSWVITTWVKHWSGLNCLLTCFCSTCFEFTISMITIQETFKPVFKGAWPDFKKNHLPRSAMEIEILALEESLYFSDYCSEISGPRYVSFLRFYKQKKWLISTKVWLPHPKFTLSSMGQHEAHFSDSMKTTPFCSKFGIGLFGWWVSTESRKQHLKKSEYVPLNKFVYYFHLSNMHYNTFWAKFIYAHLHLCHVSSKQ